MAKLINCKACGKEIAKGVKKCPNCGGDQRNFFGKHKIITGLGVLVVLGAIASMGGGSDTDKPADTTSTNQTQQSTPAQAEVKEEPKADPIVLTTDTLLDALDKNALNASKTYKDQYVEVTGVLSNIDSSGKYFSLTRNDGELTFINVMCYITKDQQDTVASFDKEQKVTVIGTISDVGEVIGYSIKVESIK